ncbi:hypothetical protein Tco_0969144 [Tanacetum coccineum]
MNLGPSFTLVLVRIIKTVEKGLGSCGIANLAILQLGKLSGGGGKGRKFAHLASVVPHGVMFDCIHGPCVVIVLGTWQNKSPKVITTIAPLVLMELKFRLLAALPLGVKLSLIDSFHPSLLFLFKQV